MVSRFQTETVEGTMKWRVMVEVTGEDGAMTQHIISTGERADAGQAATLGLNLGESKVTLAGLQRVLVTARIDAHCRRRRSCGHCKALRPLKDHRTRRLVSLFGTVEVRAPRFGPCRCGVACRRSLTPADEKMPDRCTPDYERVLAGMGSALPYRQARALLACAASPGYGPRCGNGPPAYAPDRGTGRAPGRGAAGMGSTGVA